MLNVERITDMNIQSKEVLIINSKQQLEDAFAIRKKVFVEEQQVPEEEEIDHLESEATHFILHCDGKPAGAGRFRMVDDYGKIERICILKEFRGNGSGQAIMERIQAYAKEKNVQTLKLNAQTQAIPFYDKLGYEVISEEFLDAGIPHKTMSKKI
jgi:predicted GNAT family N-acyltransferase